MSDDGYYANDRTGQVQRFDSYALHGRGIPDGWRIATPIEAEFAHRIERLEKQIELALSPQPKTGGEGS